MLYLHTKKQHYEHRIVFICGFFNIMLLKYQPTFINTSNFENPKKNVYFHSREDI